MPDASYNTLVCIAAIDRLHCSKIDESGIPDRTSQIEKGRRKPAAFVFQKTRASVLIESEPKLLILVLTRFLHANRYPLRLKTL
jgi:hypothetical protein